MPVLLRIAAALKHVILGRVRAGSDIFYFRGNSSLSGDCRGSALRFPSILYIPEECLFCIQPPEGYRLRS